MWNEDPSKYYNVGATTNPYIDNGIQSPLDTNQYATGDSPQVSSDNFNISMDETGGGQYNPWGATSGWGGTSPYDETAGGLYNAWGNGSGYGNMDGFGGAGTYTGDYPGNFNVGNGTGYGMPNSVSGPSGGGNTMNANTGGGGSLLDNPALPISLANIATGAKYINDAGRYKDLGNAAANRSDPFGQYRGSYGDKLKSLYDDPSQIENTPGYKFALEQGLGALDRKNAAGGYLGSGKASKDEMDYASGLASQTWNTEANRLAQLAGSQFDPSHAGSLMMQGGQLQLGAENQGMDFIGDGLKGLYNADKSNTGQVIQINAGNNNGASAAGGSGGSAVGLGGAGGYSNAPSQIGFPNGNANQLRPNGTNGTGTFNPSLGLHPIGNTGYSLPGEMLLDPRGLTGAGSQISDLDPIPQFPTNGPTGQVDYGNQNADGSFPGGSQFDWDQYNSYYYDPWADGGMYDWYGPE